MSKIPSKLSNRSFTGERIGIIVLLLLLIGAGSFLRFLLRNNAQEPLELSFVSDSLVLSLDEPADLAIDTAYDLNDLRFESSNQSVLTVNRGILTLLKPGSAVVTVQTLDGTLADSITLTVQSANSPEVSDDSEIDKPTSPEPEAPKEPETPVEPDPEEVVDPNVEESDNPEPETPVEPEPDEEAALHTVTVVDESMATLSSIQVTDGALLDGLLDLNEPEDFKGYYLEGVVCDDPYDLTTPITGSFILIEGRLDHKSPCVSLDSIAFGGDFRVGETITAYVSPSSATVSYTWFISDDNRDFFPLTLITGASLEITPEMFRQYLAVNVKGTGDYEGLLKLGSPRIGLNSQTIKESPPVTQVEISSWADLASIPSGPESAGIEYFLNGDLDKDSDGYADYASLSANNGEGWEPIGSSDSSAFEGSFNGNGFTISDLQISKSTDRLGLFGYVKGTGSFKNVTLQAFSITGNAFGGALIGQTSDAQITISNVAISGGSIVGNNNIGGLIGAVNSPQDNITIIGASNSADITVTATGYSPVGGIIGFSQGTLTFKDVTNHGDISGGERIGGLVGYSSGDLDVTDITNHGDISGVYYIGGLIGYSSGDLDSTIVTNHGDISGKGDLGGVIGLNSADALLQNVDNIGNVTSLNTNSSQIGGIIGVNNANLTLSAVRNYGAVSGGNQDVGGILGSNSGSNVLIEKSVNYGNVTSKINVGGVVGYNTINSKNTVLSNVANFGTISGSVQGAGGFIGFAQKPSSGLTSITNSYSVGVITGSATNKGALFGELNENNAVTVIGTFYLTGSGLNAVGVDKTVSGSITEVTIVSMTSIYTFIDAGWDINEHPTDTAIWSIGFTDYSQTYPWLTSNGTPGAAAPSVYKITDPITTLNASTPSTYQGFVSGSGVEVVAITETSVFSFSGVDSYIELGEPLETNSSYTLLAWVLDEGQGNSSRNILSTLHTVFWINGSTLSAGVDGEFSLVTSEGFPTNRWKHVAVTFDDNVNTMILYIDGEIIDINSSVGGSYTSQIFRAGAHQNSGDPNSFWNGLMNAMKIYDRVLSPTEIDTDYQSTKSLYE